VVVLVVVVVSCYTFIILLLLGAIAILVREKTHFREDDTFARKK
jgi:hypothetical protein